MIVYVLDVRSPVAFTCDVKAKQTGMQRLVSVYCKH